MSSGVGNINYEEPSGAGGGGIAVTGARDGLSVDPLNYIVLGQTVGETGSPASLIEPREIPLNGQQLNVLTQGNANLELASGPVALIFDSGTTSQQFAELLTIQGKLPLPSTFGNFQIGWIDQNLINPDGQRDAVITSGYNTDGGNGKLNPGEASFATVLETHFQQGGIGNGNFEYYLTSDTIAGQVCRHMFLVIDKVTGRANLTFQTGQLALADVPVDGGLVYCDISDAGMTLQAKTSMTVDIIGAVPATDGSLRIACVVGSGGKVEFIDESGVATGFFQFDAAAVFQTNKFANGFANYWFQSSAAAGLGFIFINTVVDPNTPLFYIHNSGFVGITQGLTVGTFNTPPAASAMIDIESTTKGFLPPRMTTVQKLAIGSPAEGLQVYDLTLHQMSYFNGTVWVNF